MTMNMHSASDALHDRGPQDRLLHTGQALSHRRPLNANVTDEREFLYMRQGMGHRKRTTLPAELFAYAIEKVRDNTTRSSTV